MANWYRSGMTKNDSDNYEYELNEIPYESGEAKRYANDGIKSSQLVLVQKETYQPAYGQITLSSERNGCENHYSADNALFHP